MHSPARDQACHSVRKHRSIGVGRGSERAPLQRRHRVAQQHQRVYSLERVLATRLCQRRLEALCRLEMVPEASVRASHGAVAGAVECGGQRQGAGAEHGRQAFSDVSSAPRVA
jgi:hypothetical protein